MQKKEKNSTGIKTNNAVITRLGDILHDSDGLICLVKLNILFIFTCLPFIPFIPFFTAGPSTKALLYCTNKLVQTGYLPDVKQNYMQAFKRNIPDSVRAGAAVVLTTCLFTGGLYFYLVMSGDNIMYIPFASLSLFMIIFIWSVATHLFPDLSENENINFRNRFSAAFSLMVNSLSKTIIAVVIAIIFIAGLILFLPASLPLLLTLGFSIPALCCAFAHTEPEFV